MSLSVDLNSGPRFQFKLAPLLVVIFLAIAIPFLAAAATSLLLHRQPALREPDLSWLYLQHGFQLVLALLAIVVLKRRVPADYGLHLPRRQSYLLPAVLWGVLFGVIMLLVDYAPELLAHTRPQLSYELTPATASNRLFFEFVYVGPTEEIPFRALLVTYPRRHPSRKSAPRAVRDELGRSDRGAPVRAPTC